MSNPISSFPLRIHANTNPSCFEQLKNCFDAVTQFVIKIFKQIGEFFYNLFHTKPNNPPGPEIPLPRAVNNPAAPIEQNRPMPLPDPKNILAFYRGEEPNVDGLTINKIIEANDNFLEENHAWVQWAFPLEKPSAINPTAPVLDKATFEAMKNNIDIVLNVVFAFDRVLNFYGLLSLCQFPIRIDSPVKIERGKNFTIAAKNWLTPGNHNFLRITRIIHSLSLMFGKQNNYSKALFDIMEDIYQKEGKGIIPDRTYQIWKNAV